VGPLLILIDGLCAFGCFFLLIFYILFVLEHMEFVLAEIILFDAIMFRLSGCELKISIRASENLSSFSPRSSNLLERIYLATANSDK